jgi:hypothetical protein
VTAALPEELARFRERVVRIPFDPGRFLVGLMTFVPPRRSAVPRPVGFPTAVASGNAAGHRLRPAKPGAERVFNRLIGYHKASRPLCTPVARLLPLHTSNRAYRGLAMCLVLIATTES